MGLFSFFERKIVAECGHITKKKDKVTAFGESTITIITFNDDKTPYCHRCLEKMAIRCAWCGHVIFIGDPITLYTPAKKDFKMPDYATVHNKDPLQLVGCLRWDCAETGADRAGFWMPPGKIERVPTAFERIVMGENSVVIGDLSKA